MKFNKRKEKKENSFSKTILFICFIVALLFFVIKVISGLLHQDIKYDVDNMEQYILKENSSEINESKLVTNYSKFHTIQDILEQFTNALINGNYEESYKVLDSEMLNKYKDKKEYISKIEEFTSNNFIIKDPDNLYLNKNKLKRVYTLSSNVDYLAEYETIDGSTKKIGVRLYTQEKEYKIFYIEM